MLKDIENPSQLKKLTIQELKLLAKEIRSELVKTVSKNGGHLASNLGIVELTIALHYVFNCPEDKLFFDVGHQAYVHKLITGRYRDFSSLRKKDGISGFPSVEESECDTFSAGHASTAISAALGMARARDIMGTGENIIAVVGDGALTGGMCYEALNDAGQSKTRMIVVLNDNEMSISRNVGALRLYLGELRQSRSYRAFKRGVRRGIERIPKIGTPIFRFVERLKNLVKGVFVDGKFFEALGFTYIGPIDGHDMNHMIRILNRVKDDNRPVLIHVVTKKGKGYQPAENRPDMFHGIAPFYVESGKMRGDHVEKTMGEIIAHQLSDTADHDIRINVVTAAMESGTGMTEFEKRHPERFFDVGIAEEHAVTMAAGMAYAGMKPYVAIYSTFLQRAYDQMMVDVCRNDLPVTFLVDRAGFVGADGSTHQGLYDLSYLRSMPNMVIAVPRDVRELKRMIDLSTRADHPMAIRYPKSAVDLGSRFAGSEPLKIGKWELLAGGNDAMMIAAGPLVQIAMQASIELMGRGFNVGVTDACFIKPLDEGFIKNELIGKVPLIVTLEENTLPGSLGEAVDHVLTENGYRGKAVNLGAADEFIPHATDAQQREMCGLNVERITARIAFELDGLRQREK